MKLLSTVGSALLIGALCAMGCGGAQPSDDGDAAVSVDAGDGGPADDGGAPATLGLVEGIRGANVVSITIDPGDSDRIFVSTGFGIWLSDDAGASFREISDGIPTPGQFVWQVAIDPVDRDTQYAAWSVGSLSGCEGQPSLGLLRRTGDGPWSPISRGIVPGERLQMCGVTDIIVDRRTPGRLFAASPRGIFRSTDRGDHWTRVLELDGHAVGLVRVALDPADSNRVFAVMNTEVWRSSDGGDRWDVTGVGHLGTYGAWSLLVDPNSPDHVMLGTHDHGVLESFDGGLSFLSTGLHPAGFWVNRLQTGGTMEHSGWISGLVARPEHGDVLASHYLSRSIYRGPTRWQDFANELPAVFVLSLAVDPNDESTIYAGLDGLGLHRSRDDGITWTRIPLGRGGARRIVTAPGGFRYTTSENGVWASEDGGRTWRDATHGLRGIPQWNITLAPDDPQTLFVATVEAGISRSDDGGRTWTPVNDGLLSYAEALDSDYVEPPVSVQALGDGSRVFASMFYSGVWRSDDGGRDWAQIYANGEGTVMGQLSVDPNDPDDILVATARSGDWLRLLRLSESRGEWISSDEGLPTIPTDSHWMAWYVAYSTAITRVSSTELLLAPGFLAAGTGQPVLYRSIDGGATWHGWDAGLPHLSFSPGVWPGLRPAVSAIAVPHDGTGPWVAGFLTDPRLFVSHDRGQTWLPLEVAPAFEDLGVFLALDPDERDILWVSTGDNGVFRVQMQLNAP